MPKNRLEAFSDGVLAIIITIMVLAMEAPEGKSWRDLGAVIPTFIGYIISYTYVGIYWVNHHRLLQSVETIKGRSLWANLLWMFLRPSFLLLRPGLLIQDLPLYPFLFMVGSFSLRPSLIKPLI
ncbi:TMEM175 family protein [Acidaminococcus intestini]|nr:TMEM175 family protein [Acidaminococcus intestini]